ncbi:MAG: enoyl-CoA hydratase/isomerase family protein [Rhodococcus fascians]
MSYRYLTVTRPVPNVAMVAMNRPEAANAINRAMLAELADALRSIAADERVHAWILTGSPRTDGRLWFSAGADMKEALKPDYDGPRVTGREVCDLIDDMLTPSIALIGGVCTTGALELAMACDVRIVATGAELSDYHLARTGMAIGAWGAAARLSRLVGVDKAKEILLLSATMTGEEAVRIGLANRVVPDDALITEGLAIASTIAAMPRKGVRTTLGYLAMQAGLSKHEAIQLADRTPELMGVKLRPFGDAASRFFDNRTSAPEPR